MKISTYKAKIKALEIENTGRLAQIDIMDANKEYWRNKYLNSTVTVNNLIRENTKMKMALKAIIDWELPYKGHIHDYGSDGERDFFREIAKEALLPKEKE